VIDEVLARPGYADDATGARLEANPELLAGLDHNETLRDEVDAYLLE
jgi:hypothetical protein